MEPQRAWHMPEADVKPGIAHAVQAGPRRSHIERALVQMQCWIFVASWTGVIKCALSCQPASRAGRSIQSACILVEHVFIMFAWSWDSSSQACLLFSRCQDRCNRPRFEIFDLSPAAKVPRATAGATGECGVGVQPHLHDRLHHPDSVLPVCRHHAAAPRLGERWCRCAA